MNILDIQGLIDNSATIYTKIEILPKTVGEEIITLTNDDSIKSWVYSDLRNVENQGFIGQFVARTLDGELQDISDDFNIEDREIVLYLGINTGRVAEIVTQSNIEIVTEENENIVTEQGSSSLTYYKLGNFFVEKPESDEVRDNTKFQSTDYTILFNNPFNADYTDSEYIKSFNEKIADEETVTALWLAQYTCKQVGVVLGSATFRNSDFIIDSNQFDDGYTCRDVIKNIAKLGVTWARIGWDNKLYLDFDKQTGTVLDYNIITNDNYYELTTQKDVYGEVNRILMGSSIVVGNSAYIEDAQSIEDNGLTELDIYDNPILYTQELRETAIENVNSMLGLMYQPVNIETTGHPWLLGNELITIVDMEGNYLNTYALDRILTYNGHIRSKISSITKTETESTYAYQGVENTELEIKRSRVELDRQNQTLTSVMERTTTNESQISSITQNINGLNVNVTSLSGDITSLQGDISTINTSLGDLSSSITDIAEDLVDVNADLNGLSVDFNDFLTNEYVQDIQDLQDQIDGVIEFWTGNDIPTLNNAPASNWTTEALKQEHIGDVYIVLSGSAQGANYRFVKDGNKWKWLEISDSQIGAVRELAQSAMNLASANALDIIDLQATDTQLQADIDGITASYRTLSTQVDELGDEYDAITTAEKNIVGNPVVIGDCGEYLIKNLTIYGNTSQTETPTPTSFASVNAVEGEHTLLVRSKNLLNLENTTDDKNNVSEKIEDNVIILNGTSTGATIHSLGGNFTLPAGTYTTSIYVEDYDTSSGSGQIAINTPSVMSDTSIYGYISNFVNTHSATATFTINEDTTLCTQLKYSNGSVYDDIKIKIQIEKGSSATSYSNMYLEEQSYTYNLSDIKLYKIGTNYVDYIYYNLADEKWYVSKRVGISLASSIVKNEGTSDSDYIVLQTTYADHTFDAVDNNNPCYSKAFSYKGNVTSASDALSGGTGIYKYYASGIHAVLITVPKSIANSYSAFKTWCEDNNVYVYYPLEEPIVEELINTDLIVALNNIRNNAKLYQTNMVVEDVETIGLKDTIKVNYLTKTVFNGIYATQSELKLTQNGIYQTVSETVTASVQDITDKVVSLNDIVDQNTKSLDNDIKSLTDSLNDYAKQSSLITVTNSVEEIQTSLNEQILVTQQIREDGVEKVTTTTGFTFDKDGLTIDKTGADTKTVVDEDGMTVYSKTGSENSILLNVDSQGVQTENLHVRTYTQIGSHSRLQDYEDGTAIFYIE